MDPELKKPLFNEQAWRKARGVLKECLDGNISDLPLCKYYYHMQDSHGNPITNQFGLQLLECRRGTNRTENVHKQIVTCFKSWNIGFRMGSALLTLFRHRFNHNVSERTRPGFPHVGHYET